MFKFVDRKNQNCIAVISGWGFDCRIFDKLNLPFNYLFFYDGEVENFEDELKAELQKNNIKKISLLGFSQGAFVACNFAGENAELIDEIILIGARIQYEKNALEKIKKYLTKNRKAYMYKFYKDCFCQAEHQQYLWFKQTLLKEYLETNSTEKLIRELDWLSNAQIEPVALNKIENIKIVHGKNDAIAPLADATKIAEQLPQTKLIIFKDSGHLPFLHEDFAKHLYD